MKMRKRDGSRQSRADTFARHNVYKQTELALLPLPLPMPLPSSLPAANANQVASELWTRTCLLVFPVCVCVGVSVRVGGLPSWFRRAKSAQWNKS